MIGSGGGDPWQRYWKAAAPGAPAGCVPDAQGPVAAATKAAWANFAAALPRGARVLDIGTGSGAALAAMLAPRRDLKAVGIDSALSLPPAPKGMQLKAGVAMERLPFPPESFHAAVSQFGFEYGATDAASAELVRVTRRGGALQLLIHHGGSIILSHNLARREALLWALAPSGVVERALAFAKGGLAMGLPVPASSAGAINDAQRLFPTQSAAAELATGVLQRLSACAGRPADALRMLEQVRGDAAGEVERLSLLDRAARDDKGIEEIGLQLGGAGFVVEAPQVLTDPGSGAPLAWLLRGVRGG